MEIKEDIQKAYNEGNLLTKLIMIECGIFLTFALLSVINSLFNLNLNFADYLAMPSSFSGFIHQPWSIFTYMFVHLEFLHFIFNIIMLYWAGKLFMQFFSIPRDMINLYILGGLIGAVTFLVAYNIFPGLQVQSSMLIGASASIMALVVAPAYLHPNYEIRLVLIGNVKLKWIALAMVVLSFISISSSNPGGNIAHLGGALTGFLFAQQYEKGHNITTWIGDIIDKIVNLFKKEKKPKWKVVYNRADDKDTNPDHIYNMRKKAQAEEIDAILDKIKKGGYESLTKDEKRRLYEASQK